MSYWRLYDARGVATRFRARGMHVTGMRRSASRAGDLLAATSCRLLSLTATVDTPCGHLLYVSEDSCIPTKERNCSVSQLSMLPYIC